MDFAAQVQKAVEACLQDTVNASREALVDLVDSVVHDTPVASGAARDSWEINGEAASNVRSVAARWSGREAFLLTNAVPYIQKLEYGHSSQAPVGMVRKNVSRVMENLNAGNYTGLSFRRR